MKLHILGATFVIVLSLCGLLLGFTIAGSQVKPPVPSPTPLASPTPIPTPAPITKSFSFKVQCTVFQQGSTVTGFSCNKF